MEKGSEGMQASHSVMASIAGACSRASIRNKQLESQAAAALSAEAGRKPRAQGSWSPGAQGWHSWGKRPRWKIPTPKQRKRTKPSTHVSPSQCMKGLTMSADELRKLGPRWRGSSASFSGAPSCGQEEESASDDIISGSSDDDQCAGNASLASKLACVTSPAKSSPHPVLNLTSQGAPHSQQSRGAPESQRLLGAGMGEEGGDAPTRCDPNPLVANTRLDNTFTDQIGCRSTHGSDSRKALEEVALGQVPWRPVERCNPGVADVACGSLSPSVPKHGGLDGLSGADTIAQGSEVRGITAQRAFICLNVGRAGQGMARHEAGSGAGGGSGGDSLASRLLRIVQAEKVRWERAEAGGVSSAIENAMLSPCSTPT
ncbi:unnamed protein product [Ostreobium quekettii]|uniref:Uncharacterized protein n=1 Tax=Ostreobium quekettii TaxID=121088 RepID=A0A8S1J9G5_9CHLO|nr:unnamed protein product [Ostreobium quekettii]|eukprot:evm.model.scf_1827.1 EVM.evm.TU.scf_1827.1   scf_1827:10986-13676(+)